MLNVEKQKQKLERMMTAMAKEQAKLLLAEREADRRADAHRKIELGGLVIASEVDSRAPAEIVGALLLAGEQVAQQPSRREHLRQKDIEHLEAREAARKGARS